MLGVGLVGVGVVGGLVWLGVRVWVLGLGLGVVVEVGGLGLCGVCFWSLVFGVCGWECGWVLGVYCSCGLGL